MTKIPSLGYDKVIRALQRDGLVEFIVATIFALAAAALYY
jgi:hypothetical protein